MGLHTSKQAQQCAERSSLAPMRTTLSPLARDPLSLYANHPTKKTPPETSSVAPSLEGDSDCGRSARADQRALIGRNTEGIEYGKSVSVKLA